MSNGQKIGYVRVSSVGQNTARQLEGKQLDEVFTDKLSGKDRQRPALEALLKHIRKGDEVYVHEMSRLGRNMNDLLNIVDEICEKEVSITFEKENMTFSKDDKNPMNMLMLKVLASFAEFERDLIKQRQAEGIAIAVKEGKFKGRAPALKGETLKQLKEKLANGESISKLAKEFGVSRPTIYKHLKKVSP